MDLNEKYGQNSQRLTSFSGLRSLFIILQFQNTPCFNFSFSPNYTLFFWKILAHTYLSYHLVGFQEGRKWKSNLCPNSPGNGTPLQYSCLENPMDEGAWQAAVYGVAKSRKDLSDFTFTFHFHPLEKEMATHSSILAWTPGTEEPSGLLSMGSHRVGHD